MIISYLTVRLEKLEQIVVDMDKLEDQSGVFKDKDVAFCCLGTTRKDAGSAVLDLPVK